MPLEIISMEAAQKENENECSKWMLSGVPVP